MKFILILFFLYSSKMFSKNSLLFYELKHLSFFSSDNQMLGDEYALLKFMALDDPNVVLDKPYLYALEKGENLSFVFGTIHVGISLEELPGYVLRAMVSRKHYADENGDNQDAKKNRGATLIYNTWDKLSEEAKKELSSKEKNPFLNIYNEEKKLVYDEFNLIEVINSYESINDVCNVAFLFSIADISYKFGILDHNLEEVVKLVATKYQYKTKIITLLDTNKKLVIDHGNALTRPNCEKYPVVTGSLEKYKQEFTVELKKYIKGEENTGNPKDTYLGQRNKLWVPTLNSLHQDGGFSAAFGVDHLGGEFGVLALLKEQNFTITRITSDQHYESIVAKYPVK